MEKLSMILVLIWSLVWLVSCIPQRSKSETIKKVDSSSGKVTVIDEIIQRYETEHKKFYDEEIGYDNQLEWPALDNKVLSIYCKKFLQYSVPGRKIDNVYGFKVRKELHYKMENISMTSTIVIVHCKVMKIYPLSYYITRAPEPDCIYALNLTHEGTGNVLSIINKYCNFEEISLKRKRVEIIGKVHRATGQRIANEEHLLEYELEHHELLKRESGYDKQVNWPHAMLRGNLEAYCYQYLEKCAPNRNREGVTGTWKINKLYYQKLNIKEVIQVTIVTCQLPYKCCYHITRAPEDNCVFAVLRKGHSNSPLVIIFKYCDFENPNKQQIVVQDPNSLLDKNIVLRTKINEEIFNKFGTFDKNVIPKSKVKEEISDTLETMQLFPEDQVC